METQALDDLTPDDLTPDDDVAAHRAKAKTELDQIAGQARQALTEQGLGDISLFFLIPNSGDSILAFGTPGDPDDHLWNRVGEIVAAIVRQTVGLDRYAVQTSHVCHHRHDS